MEADAARGWYELVQGGLHFSAAFSEVRAPEAAAGPEDLCGLSGSSFPPPFRGSPSCAPTGSEGPSQEMSPECLRVGEVNRLLVRALGRRYRGNSACRAQDVQLPLGTERLRGRPEKLGNSLLLCSEPLVPESKAWGQGGSSRSHALLLGSNPPVVALAPCHRAQSR